MKDVARRVRLRAPPSELRSGVTVDYVWPGVFDCSQGATCVDDFLGVKAPTLVA